MQWLKVILAGIIEIIWGISMLIYHESKKLSRILCLLLIIMSVIGLKLIS